jgi:hypothetical protein
MLKQSRVSRLESWVDINTRDPKLQTRDYLGGRPAAHRARFAASLVTLQGMG